MIKLLKDVEEAGGLLDHLHQKLSRLVKLNLIAVLVNMLLKILW